MDIHEQIEKVRADMHLIALERGLSDPLVVEKSQQLDELLNLMQSKKDDCMSNRLEASNLAVPRLSIIPKYKRRGINKMVEKLIRRRFGFNVKFDMNGNTGDYYKDQDVQLFVNHDTDNLFIYDQVGESWILLGKL